METFGQFLKNAIGQKGYTTKAFSEKSGISTVQIINIEKNRNKPNGLTINKIAKALELDYDYVASKLN